MPTLAEALKPYLAPGRPIVVHGNIPEGFDDSPLDLVKGILEARKNEINMFPAFSGQIAEGAVVELATAPILTGSIPVAALEVLSANARTLHPTHSWIVTGRSAAMHIPGNVYAMSPSGMGCPLGEVTNFSGLEIIVGGDFSSSVVIEAAEEAARVHYALGPTPISFKIIDANGKEKSDQATLRSHSQLNRNRDRVKQIFTEADALIEEDWGTVIHTRMALDKLTAKFREEPTWLIEN